MISLESQTRIVVRRRDFNRLAGTVLVWCARPAVTDTQKERPLEDASDRRPVRREVAGVRIPDSALADKATEFARQHYEPPLFNHAMRTFLFGLLLGKATALNFDVELLYLASLLHDLGLTASFRGELPFEIQGAQAAAAFLTGAGLGADKVGTVWDGIALHCNAVSQYKRPEVALVATGAGADVVGASLGQLPVGSKDDILREFPRLDFKNSFVRTCSDVIRLYPGTAGRTFMRDIGERNVKDFKVENICDAIQRSPFDE